MSRGRHTFFGHTFFGPHWPNAKDVLQASPQDIGAMATAYQQGVEHRAEKGQPVPKAQIFPPDHRPEPEPEASI